MVPEDLRHGRADRPPASGGRAPPPPLPRGGSGPGPGPAPPPAAGAAPAAGTAAARQAAASRRQKGRRVGFEMQQVFLQNSVNCTLYSYWSQALLKIIRFWLSLARVALSLSPGFVKRVGKEKTKTKPAKKHKQNTKAFSPLPGFRTKTI